MLRLSKKRCGFVVEESVDEVRLFFLGWVAMDLAGGVGKYYSVCWKREGVRRSGVNYRTWVGDINR